MRRDGLAGAAPVCVDLGESAMLIHTKGRREIQSVTTTLEILRVLANSASELIETVILALGYNIKLGWRKNTESRRVS